MSTISTAITDMKEQNKNARAECDRLRDEIVRGRKIEPGDHLIVAAAGKTLDQFEAECEEAAAAEADRRAAAEAGRIQRGALADAQAVAAKLGADAAAIDAAIGAVVGAILAVVRPAVEKAREHVNSLFGEVSHLQHQPNKFALMGRRERIKAAEYALKIMPQRYGDPRIDQSSTAHEIQYATAELAGMKAAPVQFVTTSKLPPAPEPVDLYTAAVAAVLVALAKTIPADKQAEAFGIFATLVGESSKAATLEANERT